MAKRRVARSRSPNYEKKGCEETTKANVLRNSKITTVPGQVVHIKFRKNFCSPTGISSAVKRLRPATDSDDCGSCPRRSISAPFDYKTHCFFCGCGDKYDKRTNHMLLPQNFKNSAANLH